MDVRSIVLCAQGGDMEAFNQLIALHANRLRQQVIRMYRTRGWDFVDEVVFGTIRRAWEKLATYDPDKSAFLTWLCWQARHVAGEQTRFWHYKRETSLEDMVRLGMVPSIDGPDREFEADRARRALWQEIRSLPRDLRIPLILYACDGYTVAEIAARLGLGAQAVRYRLKQAREMLARRLGKGWQSVGSDADWVHDIDEQGRDTSDLRESSGAGLDESSPGPME